MKEHFDFFFDIKSLSRLIYYLPFSRYLDPIETDNEAVKNLWKKKYKLELYLALLFVGIIVSIPLMEFVIFPLVLRFGL